PGLLDVDGGPGLDRFRHERLLGRARRREVPLPAAPIPGDAGQQTVVLTEGEGLAALLLPLEGPILRSWRRRVEPEEVDPVVAGSRGKPAPGVAEGQGLDALPGSTQDERRGWRSRGARAPDADRSIEATGRKPAAVGAEDGGARGALAAGKLA